MIDASQFGVVFFLLLLTLTGTSYVIEKYQIINRMLSHRIPKFLLWTIFAINSIIGIFLLLIEPALGLLLVYISILLIPAIKSNHKFHWMPGIIKMGYLFVAVYAFLWIFEDMSIFEKAKLVLRS